MITIWDFEVKWINCCIKCLTLIRSVKIFKSKVALHICFKISYMAFTFIYKLFAIFFNYGIKAYDSGSTECVKLISTYDFPISALELTSIELIKIFISLNSNLINKHISLLSLKITRYMNV